MSRHIIVLADDTFREKAIDYIRRAPADSRIEFKGPLRSKSQNAKMWTMLSDIARQLVWHGHRLTADEWKLLFLDALNREEALDRQPKLVPALDGPSLVDLSKSSSDLSWHEMGNMLTLIQAFGDQAGVVFTPPRKASQLIQETEEGVRWASDTSGPALPKLDEANRAEGAVS
jgi:hypothetical protein